MVSIAPRIPDSLLDELGRNDDDSLPIAELHRRLGKTAARLGVPQPSYERVRQIAHGRRNGRPAENTVFLLYQTGNSRPADTLVERLAELVRSAR